MAEWVGEQRAYDFDSGIEIRISFWPAEDTAAPDYPGGRSELLSRIDRPVVADRGESRELVSRETDVTLGELLARQADRRVRTVASIELPERIGRLAARNTEYVRYYPATEFLGRVQEEFSRYLTDTADPEFRRIPRELWDSALVPVTRSPLQQPVPLSSLIVAATGIWAIGGPGGLCVVIGGVVGYLVLVEVLLPSATALGSVLADRIGRNMSRKRGPGSRRGRR